MNWQAAVEVTLEHMRRRGSLNVVSFSVRQLSLSHFANLKRKDDNATPSPEQSWDKLKAQPNYTLSEKADLHSHLSASWERSKPARHESLRYGLVLSCAG